MYYGLEARPLGSILGRTRRSDGQQKRMQRQAYAHLITGQSWGSLKEDAEDIVTLVGVTVVISSLKALVVPVQQGSTGSAEQEKIPLKLYTSHGGRRLGRRGSCLYTLRNNISEPLRSKSPVEVIAQWTEPSLV